MNPSDQLSALQSQVREAAAAGNVLSVRGSGSKSWLVHPVRSDAISPLLDMRTLAGIVDYEPTELVVTVRAGTPLAELEQVLGMQGQCLPFEPPRFARANAAATVGGMIAAGLSGPGRLGAGAVRDYVLGALLLNGRGELLNFGGKVMKNVAGFDVARMLVGSMGTLGAICEVSLKVLPRQPAEATLMFDLDHDRAIQQVNAWCAQPLPISASAWLRQGSDEGPGRLHLRLRGARAAVAAACERLGGERQDDAAAADFWEALREQTHPWFASTWAQPGDAGKTLWRIAVPPTTPPLKLQGSTLIEWGGAQRWLQTALPAAFVREAVGQTGGHATCFRGGDASTPVFTPPAPPLDRIHHQIKRAFDPDGVFPTLFDSQLNGTPFNDGNPSLT